ncbi:MAG: exodeoxyribonuclease VII small subunit [Acidimicrobiales bacterium]
MPVDSTGGGEGASSSREPRYEELVEELERLTRAMSSPEVGIEEATELYERASLVHEVASKRLEQLKQRVDKLKRPEAG